jgi:hypothetical protein
MHYSTVRTAAIDASVLNLCTHDSQIVTLIVYLVQVAEYGEEEEVVGVIKACTRMVSRGKKHSFSASKPQQCKFVKVACLLGLRVSPSHR